MQTYWRVRRPYTRGAVVALWHAGELLFVENSYRRGISLPGGGIERGEPPRLAACRELRQEVGIEVAPETLRPVVEMRSPLDGKNDRLWLFEHFWDNERDGPPAIRVDNREVVWAGFIAPKKALRQKTARADHSRLPSRQAKQPKVGG
jgi:8-oxo-dGTP diphosphatase